MDAIIGQTLLQQTRIEAPLKERTIFVLLQISHRIGTIALLATLCIWAIMWRAGDFHLPLAVSAGCGDIGLCTALLARMLTRPGQIARREANGVAIFNLVFFVLSLHLMLVTRLDVIRAAANQFFTPSPINSPMTSSHG